MRRATDWSCLFTGRRADHLHHLTLTRLDGSYRDRTLVAPVCRGPHVLVHQHLRRVGIDDLCALPDDYVRLIGIGQFLVVLAVQHGDGVMPVPAFVLQECGIVLGQIAERLLDREMHP